MPTYTITDPQTGKTLKVTGDSPPTEQELEELFASSGASAPTRWDDKTAIEDPESASDVGAASKQGFIEGATDAAGRLVKSGAGAFLSALNPVNTIRMMGQLNPVTMGQRVATDLVNGAPQAQAAGKQLLSGFKSLNPADPNAPEAWGAIGGNLAAMKAAPAMMRGAPGALEGTGNLMTKVGEAARFSRSGFGLPGLTAAMGHPGTALAELLIPPTLRGAGRLMTAAGRAMRPAVEPKLGQIVEEGPGFTKGDILDVPAVRGPQPTPVPETPTHGPVAAGASSLSGRPGLPPAQQFDMPASSKGNPLAIEGAAQRLGLPPARSIQLGPSTLAPEPVQAVAESLLAPPHDAVVMGTPRVLSWKPGAGPSPGDVAALRAVEGAKATAKRLRIPVSKVNELAPIQRPTTLPTAARDRIAARVSTLNTPESIQAYLDAAPNEMTRSFIEGLLKIR